IEPRVIRGKPCHSVAISGDGAIITAGYGDGAVRLWNVESGQSIKVLKHTTAVRIDNIDNDFVVSADGALGVSAHKDGTISIVDIRRGGTLATLLHLPDGWVSFTPDGHYKLGGDTAGAFWHQIGDC